MAQPDHGHPDEPAGQLDQGILQCLDRPRAQPHVVIQAQHVRRVGPAQQEVALLGDTAALGPPVHLHLGTVDLQGAQQAGDGGVVRRRRHGLVGDHDAQPRRLRRQAGQGHREGRRPVRSGDEHVAADHPAPPGRAAAAAMRPVVDRSGSNGTTTTRPPC